MKRSMMLLLAGVSTVVFSTLPAMAEDGTSGDDGSKYGQHDSSGRGNGRLERSIGQSNRKENRSDREALQGGDATGGQQTKEEFNRDRRDRRQERRDEGGRGPRDRRPPPPVGDEGRGRDEIRHDRQEINHDRQEIREDRRALRNARQQGDEEGMRRAQGELRQDRRELRQDRRELNHDRRELRHEEGGQRRHDRRPPPPFADAGKSGEQSVGQGSHEAPPQGGQGENARHDQRRERGDREQPGDHGRHNGRGPSGGHGSQHRR